MPLFGKRDDAEKRFKEAERYTDPTDPSKEEFNLDKAIRLLEEALMLKPDKKKYRERLEQIRELKAKIITSSTSKHPTPKDVYLFLLSKLEGEGGEDATFFLERGGKRIWVGVAFDEETVVTFSYPYDEDPNQLIFKLGISFPAGYVVSDWERQAFALVTGARCAHLELADTIDALFIKLLGAPPNYVVQGWID